MQELEKEVTGNALEGGFNEPVFDSQKVFDAIMNAMARPGSIVTLPILAHAPEPLFSNTAAIIATFCDADTMLWLDENSPQSEALKEWIAFQAAAPLTQRECEAQFAVLTDTKMRLNIGDFAQGSQEYPDRSTTLIIQVEQISNDTDLSLSGPGIKDNIDFSVQGLPEQFLDQWRNNNACFPCGVDVILVSDTSLACLPRTTKITQGVV